MQIRIIIKWSPAAWTAHLAGVRSFFQRLRCRVSGQHREELLFSHDRLALRCRTCGWQSPGWAVVLAERWRNQVGPAGSHHTRMA